MASSSRKRKWEETRNLTEEKAVAEALSKIRTLRDCLKKERIYLEGLKNRILAGKIPGPTLEFKVPAAIASTSSASGSSSTKIESGEVDMLGKKQDDSSDDD